MKIARLVMPVALCCASCSYTSVSESVQPEPPPHHYEPIRLNTVGYLPDAPKVATVGEAFKRFKVIREPIGEVVLTGTSTGPMRNPDTDEALHFADFSELTEPGTYRLVLDDESRSPSFEIVSDIYVDPFRLVTRGMYLWRCGTAVNGEQDGEVFSHAACHLEDGYGDYIGKPGQQIDGTGGWHDAGDYNKYVTNAGVTVGVMLRAWERYGNLIERVRLDLPEAGNGTPEYLSEIRWKLGWLLKMQAEDGRVYHKLSSLNFSGFIQPEDYTEKRYFTPWSSMATADFVAMMAMAARVYEPYDADFATQCLEAATLSYNYLDAYPDDVRADLEDFSTGGYQSDDADDRLWAAAELWETTGETRYLDDFETRARELDDRIEEQFDWHSVANLGMFTYLQSQRDGRDEQLVADIRQSLLDTANQIVNTAANHGYARPSGDDYWWGVNGGVARQTMILTLAYDIDPNPHYRSTALDAINHLLGRNVFGRSYVTGLGYRPPMNPHDRRSGSDDVENPWPGYLVGGPNPGATDWYDIEADFRTNEIAMNWNAALIYAFAVFLPQVDDAP